MRLVSSATAELQSRCRNEHHVLQHFVFLDRLQDFFVIRNAIGRWVAAAIKVKVPVLYLQVAVFSHMGRVHLVADVDLEAAKQKNRNRTNRHCQQCGQ
jgi:hypothetical protein